ncbi:Fur family transcriptional regulator [Ottowia testudinis]|uniref:Transcriptional repressor n=1 Tax=Ottowia testudinis TaxID=2816950 RepID=A0A975H279_9BURK|nr:Fur family transcriptional regulator [Ottowia testudinis]QTD43906.1 transcriptional repressor [Ottowia testudinis]
MSPSDAPTLCETTLQQRLTGAAAHCAGRGAQLTAQRTEVLELLLRRGGQAKAYDLQDDMQARHGRIAPTTVYRALDFLQEQQLVHKVDATNTFVFCDHADHDHPALLLICTGCGRIDELHDTRALASLLGTARQRGMAPRAVEVKCLCTGCQA